MSETPQAAPPPPSRPMPRPPGAAKPRSPRAPRGKGGQLEPKPTSGQLARRTVAWMGLLGVGAAMAGCAAWYFFPRTIREKKTKFKIGPPTKYGVGVDDSLQGEHRIWVCRDATKIYVILAVCTHLGCTPNWVGSENKFKCPCHGSGYDAEGVNFEGPAPRPMERCHVSLAPDGQIVVDKLILFREKEWGQDGAFLLA